MRDRQKRKLYFIAAAVTAAAMYLFSGCGDSQEEALEEISLSDETADAGADTPAQSGETAGETEEKGSAGTDRICVYVCGAVCSPGVYELDPDARVYEAVERAGGMTAEAAPESVNQARPLADGEQIRILTREEAEQQGTEADRSAEDAGADRKVNINTAGKEELMTLNGIGEAKAQSILDYREANGGFGSTEELMEIEGIKEGVFNKIKDDITI